MMKKLYFCCFSLVLFALPAQAQQANTVASCGSITFDAGGGPHGLLMDTKGRLCVDSPAYPSGSTVITGNATGSTGAVVGTLAAAAGKTTYICGFNVSSIGGTAASSPITVAGLIGSSQVYQTPVNGTAGLILVQQTFTPCIQASATNTAITITTTAAAGATAVDVNSWGFQQ